MRVATRTGPDRIHFAGPTSWVASLYLIAALLAQVELVHFVALRGAELSIVLVVVVWYALRSNMLAASIFGLAAGLCEDLLSAQTGAAWTLSTTMTAVVVSWLTRWFFADSIPVVAFVVILATLLRRMLFWVVMALEGYPPGYARLHLHEALWEALFNAVFAGIAMIVARRLEERAER